MDDEAFGVVLRRYRLRAGLSQEDLAERAGLSARGVSDLERGVRRLPRHDTVRRLADALQVDHSGRDRLIAAARPELQREIGREHVGEANWSAPQRFQQPAFEDIPVSPIAYARTGDISIAYQVIGAGGFDLVMTPPFMSNLEVDWEHPLPANFRLHLGSFARTVTFDKRGMGLSDRVVDVPTLDARMDDLRAVMDAAKVERGVLFGLSEGGAMSMAFAAAYPKRVSALVLYGASARDAWAPDYPFGYTEDDLEEMVAAIERDWGRNISPTIAELAPSMAGDAEFVAWLSRSLRLSASPAAAIALARMNFTIDVRSTLPAIQAPTLVLVRPETSPLALAESRYITDRIPDARLVELPGLDYMSWVGDQDAFFSALTAFLDDIGVSSAG